MTSDDLSGRVIGGRYRVSAKLGAGGMGAVYAATDLRLERTVALKVITGTLDAGALARFEHEAKAAARLDHPNVVRVLDWSAGAGAGDAPYLVMEHAPGTSLSRVIAASGPMQPARACAIAAQILEALAAAHRQGVIHRDVKPGNVLLMTAEDGADRVKVVDFGIAKILDDPSAPRTTVGSFLGTLGYMPPERLLGAPGDARTDLYAVGVTLYEMLSGRRPFSPLQGQDLLTAVITHDPPPLAGVTPAPPALADVVDRAIARQLERRFTSAEQMLGALDLVRRGVGPYIPSVSPTLAGGGATIADPTIREHLDPTPTTTRSTGSPLLIAAAFAAMTVAAGLLLFFVYRERLLPEPSSIDSPQSARGAAAPSVDAASADANEDTNANANANANEDDPASASDRSDPSTAAVAPPARQTGKGPAAASATKPARSTATGGSSRCICAAYLLTTYPVTREPLCPFSGARDTPVCRCGENLCREPYDYACPTNLLLYTGPPGSVCAGYEGRSAAHSTLSACNWCRNPYLPAGAKPGDRCTGYDRAHPPTTELVGQVRCD